ncbi:unnamed protein product [Musa acuminata subsp. malaccensis]|uniref:(wild Malaysian banana) hypothetical protein n=2 Tax=Musa acuminata TaxID=4641 RepID=A0A804J8X8_MUSAM|nr:PREDICTED: 23 kDa jasmonate-induced protein-like [Musa acuminata subsp. malaccensis]CAG1839844.1 unnamed protein product [Musa acuminata subsp. malaccensis]
MANNVFGDPIDTEFETLGNANNVFGDPITDETLEGVTEYAKKLRKLRVAMALDTQMKGNKYESALKYVREMKERWGTGVSTLCLVYNATGEPLTLHSTHDWWGHIYDQSPYPMRIGNGQWGAYLHVKRSGTPDGSNAAVVYRGKNDGGDDTDSLLFWDNPWNKASYSNQAYAEINQAGYYDNIDWGVIAGKGSNAGPQYRAAWKGCVSTVVIESGTTAKFEATLTFE